MSLFSESGAEAKASQDISRASSPNTLGSSTSLTPSAESSTITPASTVDTQNGAAVVEEASMSGQGPEGHEAHAGTETPRKPDVHPTSLELQLGELQARLKSLEMQAQSERSMERMMEIMDRNETPEDHPLVTTIASDALLDSMEEDEYFYRMMRRDEPSSVMYRMMERHHRRRNLHGEDYVSRAIRLFEGEIEKLRDAKQKEAQIEEERDVIQQERDELLKKEILWKDERMELLRKLDELQPPDEVTERSSEGSDDGDSTASKQDVEPVPRAELNYLDWESFNLRHAKQVQVAAIEVLQGDPVLPWEATQPNNQLGLNNPSTGNRTTVTHSIASDDRSKPRKTKLSTPGQAPVPERIRINSALILKILEDIRSGSDDSGSDRFSSSSVVMLRPYRFLVYHDKSIRSKFEKLEAEFGQKKSEIDNDIATDTPKELDTGSAAGTEALTTEIEEKPTSESGESEEGNSATTNDDDEQDSTFSLEAYENLRCLIQFMDEHLVKKMSYLSGDQCRTVAFSDIWYLFKPGDEVIEQSGLQAYRIMSVSSAPHKAISPYWLRGNWVIEDRSREDTPVVLFCVHVDFEGKDLGPRIRKVRISKFDGERPVTALEVYPLRFAEDRGTHFGAMEVDGADKPHDRTALRQRLIDRGRLFMSMTKFKHMHYSGLTLDTRDEVDSHVVVDFEEAFTHARQKETDESENDSSSIIYDSSPAQQGWRPKLNKLAARELEEDFEDEYCDNECCKRENIHKDAGAEKKRNEEYRAQLMPQDRQREPPPTIYPQTLSPSRKSDVSISEEDLVVMSHRVFGFVLRTRKWAKLDINHLSLPDGFAADHGLKAEGATGHASQDAQGVRHEDQTAFGHLVLPSGHKEMVKSLIAQHFRDKDAASMESQTHQADIVRGKGKGLIILLHGAPGVGKTTTAEGVAEMFQKPLFQITCGDLGTSARDVEGALEMHFTLANRWGCILLLDEADVFLAARSKQDFERNGLVSVFLRVLEYYAGILFLTTNRVGDFDEAFASRIHISLYYPQLDSSNTLSIFELNLKMIKERFKRRGRKIKIEKDLILQSAAEYFRNHEKERWNGRQIRNACQTALALAEYRAQGSNHVQKVDLDVQVELKKKDLDTVSDAYLHFIRYINGILGDSETHAQRMRTRGQDPVKTDVQSNTGAWSVSDGLVATSTPLPASGPWSPPPASSPSATSPQPPPVAGHTVSPSQFGTTLGPLTGYYPPRYSQPYGQTQMTGMYGVQGDFQGGVPQQAMPQQAFGSGQVQPVHYQPHSQYPQLQAYGNSQGQVPGFAPASPVTGNIGTAPASSQAQ